MQRSSGASLWSVESRLQKRISQTRGGCSTYFITGKDARSLCRTCSIAISWNVGSRELATIFSSNRFESALTFPFIILKIFIAATAFENIIYFWNCLKCSLPLLNGAGKYVLSIASRKKNRNAWFNLNVAFEPTAPAKNVFHVLRVWNGKAEKKT